MEINQAKTTYEQELQAVAHLMSFVQIICTYCEKVVPGKLRITNQTVLWNPDQKLKL